MPSISSSSSYFGSVLVEFKLFPEPLSRQQSSVDSVSITGVVYFFFMMSCLLDEYFLSVHDIQSSFRMLNVPSLHIIIVIVMVNVNVVYSRRLVIE